MIPKRLIVEKYVIGWFLKVSGDTEKTFKKQVKKLYDTYFKNHPGLKVGRKESDKTSKHATITYNIAKNLSETMKLKTKKIYIIIEYEDDMISYARPETETVDEMFNNMHRLHIQMKEHKLI